MYINACTCIQTQTYPSIYTLELCAPEKSRVRNEAAGHGANNGLQGQRSKTLQQCSASGPRRQHGQMEAWGGPKGVSRMRGEVLSHRRQRDLPTATSSWCACANACAVPHHFVPFLPFFNQKYFFSWGKTSIKSKKKMHTILQRRTILLKKSTSQSFSSHDKSCTSSCHFL